MSDNVFAGVYSREDWRALQISERGECEIWTGAVNRKGYGQFTERNPDKHTVWAHRRSWETAYGAIPSGLLVLHHCDNPPCIRPDHLWLGTNRENMEDMYAKDRGKKATGLANGNGKLTEEMKLEIVTRYGPPRGRGGPERTTEVTTTSLATEYGISAVRVSQLVKAYYKEINNV